MRYYFYARGVGGGGGKTGRRGKGRKLRGGREAQLDLPKEEVFEGGEGGGGGADGKYDGAIRRYGYMW